MIPNIHIKDVAAIMEDHDSFLQDLEKLDEDNEKENKEFEEKYKEILDLDYHFCKELNVDYMIYGNLGVIYYNSSKDECYTEHGMHEEELKLLEGLMGWESCFVSCYYYDYEEVCLRIRESSKRKVSEEENSNFEILPFEIQCNRDVFTADAIQRFEQSVTSFVQKIMEFAEENRKQRNALKINSEDVTAGLAKYKLKFQGKKGECLKK